NGLASADVGEASFSEAVPVHEERASDPTTAMVRQRSIRLLVLRLGLAFWPGIMLLSLQIRSVVMWNDLVTAFCCCDLVHVIQREGFWVTFCTIIAQSVRDRCQ